MSAARSCWQLVPKTSGCQGSAAVNMVTFKVKETHRGMPGLHRLNQRCFMNLQVGRASDLGPETTQRSFSPIEMISAAMPVFNFVLRRRGSCIGWQCLTSAEQFGVIFSSIIVFLILSLVYMYCLGKAITYRRSKESREPSRYIDSGAIIRHAAINVPTAPSTALYPTIALITPAYYNQVAIPFPQSHMTPIAFRGIPIAAPTYRRDAGQSIPISQPSTNASEPGCKQGGQRANIVNPNISAESQTTTPGWRQLLRRALRLPVGQAHTIYSESNHSSPRDSRSETVGSPGCAQQSDIQTRNVDERVERQPRVHSAEDSSAEDGYDEAETASIATDAATVHSDDFQMLSPPSSIDSPSAVKRRKSVPKGLNFYRSHYIPSTSSIHTALELRPVVSQRQDALEAS